MSQMEGHSLISGVTPGLAFKEMVSIEPTVPNSAPAPFYRERTAHEPPTVYSVDHRDL